MSTPLSPDCNALVNVEALSLPNTSPSIFPIPIPNILLIGDFLGLVIPVSSPFGPSGAGCIPGSVDPAPGVLPALERYGVGFIAALLPDL